jgi:hypothetical protein
MWWQQSESRNRFARVTHGKRLSVRRLRRSLEKDPKRRVHDIARRTNQLEETLAQTSALVASHRICPRPSSRTMRVPGPRVNDRSRQRCRWPQIVRAGSLASQRCRPVGSGPRLSFLSTPRGHAYSGDRSSALSARRDARHVPTDVASRSWRDGMAPPPPATHVWVRPLDGLVAQSLAGTRVPIPVLVARLSLHRVPARQAEEDRRGRRRALVVRRSLGATGAWNRDDVILFTPKSPLYRVSASGGIVPGHHIRCGERGHPALVPLLSARRPALPLFHPGQRAPYPRGVYIRLARSKRVKHAVATGHIREMRRGTPDLPARQHAHGAAVQCQPS